MNKSGAIIAHRLLVDDQDIDDNVKCTLPDVQFLTSNIKGAGIMGSVDVPLYGLTDSLPFSIDLRTVGKNAVILLKPGIRKIELRFNQDVVATSGDIVRAGTKIFISGMAKGVNAGNVERTATMDGSASYEVVRYRMVADGQEVLLIDKFNEVYKVGGVDCSPSAGL